MLPLLALLAAAPDLTAITAGQPWKYDVKVEQSSAAGVRSTGHAFRSREPLPSKERLKTFLSFHVRIDEHASPDAAARAFAKLAASADPNTGLSYAWDVVLLDGARVVHLAVPCLYSGANVDAMAKNLERVVLEGRAPAGKLRCACGLGCDVVAGAKAK
jgi:hypothetical protein